MDRMDKMDRTDKIYNMADNLDAKLISELTDELDFQKITTLNADSTKKQNKKYLFKRLSLAASVAVMTVFVGLVTMSIGIAANMLIPRFFPGMGTVDVEPQAIRELAEPVYLENPEMYNVAIDYAAFIRNGDGSGTLLLEYTYVFGSAKPSAEVNKIFAGDFAEDEEPGEEDLAAANEYANEMSKYTDFFYTAEPCMADEVNNNLAVPEISLSNYDLKDKYNYERINAQSLGDIIENIEESEYYKLTFDNGQTAVIHLTPTDYEPAQSLWSNDEAGFKIRVTPYSKDYFRYGFEIFPTEDWSDTSAFSINFIFMHAILDSNNYEPDVLGRNGEQDNISLFAHPYQNKKSRTKWDAETNLPIIPDNTYKDLKGRELHGFNNSTVGYKSAFKDFLDNTANKGALFRSLEKDGELEEYLEMMKEAGIEFPVYTEDDFWIKSLNTMSIGVDVYFNEKKAERQKIKLPEDDGEIILNQEVVIKGMKYYINKVRRNGNQAEIDITTEWNEITKEKGGLNGGEYADLQARVLDGAQFGVDGGYEYNNEFINSHRNNQYLTITVDGIDAKTKNLSIYMFYASFTQYNNWTVDITDISESVK